MSLDATTHTLNIIITTGVIHSETLHDASHNGNLNRINHMYTIINSHAGAASTPGNSRRDHQIPKADAASNAGQQMVYSSDTRLLYRILYFPLCR